MLNRKEPNKCETKTYFTQKFTTAYRVERNSTYTHILPIKFTKILYLWAKKVEGSSYKSSKNVAQKIAYRNNRKDLIFYNIISVA